MKRKGFTLIELLVVIAIIAMLLAILMPALNKVKKIAQRVVCGTNLKGLGTAQSVYANDYEDQFTRHASGAASINWNIVTAGWQNPKQPWTGEAAQVTISSSLYLLVREADVSPKSFVCGGGGQTVFDGKNNNNYDLVELWDFGGPNNANAQERPSNHQSYSMHMPYSKYAASGSTSASFAVMADKNPWMDPKLVESQIENESAASYFGKITRMGRYFIDNSGQKEKWQIQIANAYPHGREGQNVAFGDGHSEYAKTADVGVRHDAIYTKQNGAGAVGNEPQVRCGLTAPGSYVVPRAIIQLTPAADVYGAPNYQPAGPEDSLLMNDDE
jgi:prepilin-type N-terminal cleavage/methylation domain-containing protein